MRKPKKWTYVGDMKCPNCGLYHKVKASGRGAQMKLHMVCGEASFMKTIGFGWMLEAEYWNQYENQLKALAMLVGRR